MSGDWDLRTFDLDTIFSAETLSDTCIDAAIRSSAKFSPYFPGWFLYRRVVNGTTLFDRQLEAWAIMCARQLARSEKENGRKWVSGAVRAKPGWIAQAGRDALDFAIFGRYPEGLHERAERFGIAHKTYQAIRDPVSRCMWIGLDTYRAMLHMEYRYVRADEKYPAMKRMG
ncbi:MAG: hypothetical protein JSR70_07625 [Proteobacteria bacterium]|nr:hypothetical protein [Pseudomonadota bacterium]